ncbi:MFS transporter [Palleronia caenipelagi]|uniref:MFS transporter n=1 Tax=Palleronia caenipelagi TaxID=2489174 RepID=A0A547Q9H7_9RHOB|nr:MFS transporter [Palleronia caenipelagi]TRD23055.1 MFS transporter [Palleronia caenipelagi]
MAVTQTDKAIFGRLTRGSTGPGGLSPAAARVEPASFTRHVTSLTMTKVADGLLDPKLVLSWLLTHLGAGAGFVGLLVPIRESLALLPQLFTAPLIHGMSERKWAWALGSIVQGLACLVIVLAALTTSGATAGVLICGALAVLATARSVCSVSYKDVLGKTVGQSRRGAVTGSAASVASVGVIVFALMLTVAGEGRAALVIGAIALAGVLWIGAGAIFLTIAEDPEPGTAAKTPWQQLRLLTEDRQLRLFIWTRGLLTATALAPPYLLVLTPAGGAFSHLGSLVLASAAASFLSSYVWGRMSDRSSRRVLILSGVSGALALAVALILHALGLTQSWWALPFVLFALMIAYHGVRQGRSTYLVDMAPGDQRAAYTAVSNTVIGVVLMASGLFGALAALFGPAVTIAAFTLMSGAAAFVATRLDEVE